MPDRFALIVASYEYEDASLRKLVAPAQDAEALARVLSDLAIGGFEVTTLLNESSYQVNQEIESLFIDRKRDDLLLLYFSGHGIKDEEGRLYFATTNTRRKMLRSTAIPATLVNDVMRSSRSRQQVLVLDCCYSGAFAEGMVAKADREIGTKQRFKGRGRVVLTASDALQYSFEGEEVAGEGVQSVFTRTLIYGLNTGDADLDRDGLVSIDELYGYIFDRISDVTPQQRPGKWAFGIQGDIIIARNPHLVARPGDLPRDLQQSIKDSRPWVRVGAVVELLRLLRTSDADLVLAAHEALQRLVEDESGTVSAAATKSLDLHSKEQLLKQQKREQEERQASEQAEAKRLAAQKAEEERIAREKAEQDQLEQQSRNLATELAASATSEQEPRTRGQRLGFDQFTECAQDASNRSIKILQRYGHNQVDTEHILLALLEQTEGTVSQVLEKLGVDVSIMRDRLDETLRHSPKVAIYSGGTGQIFITPRVKRILDFVQEETNRLTGEHVSPEDMFLAILNERNTSAARILADNGITKDRFTEAIKRLSMETIPREPPEHKEQEREQRERQTSKQAGAQRPATQKVEEERIAREKAKEEQLKSLKPKPSIQATPAIMVRSRFTHLVRRQIGNLREIWQMLVMSVEHAIEERRQSLSWKTDAEQPKSVTDLAHVVPSEEKDIEIASDPESWATWFASSTMWWPMLAWFIWTWLGTDSTTAPVPSLILALVAAAAWLFTGTLVLQRKVRHGILLQQLASWKETGDHAHRDCSRNVPGA